MSALGGALVPDRGAREAGIFCLDELSCGSGVQAGVGAGAVRNGLLGVEIHRQVGNGVSILVIDSYGYEAGEAEDGGGCAVAVGLSDVDGVSGKCIGGEGYSDGGAGWQRGINDVLPYLVRILFVCGFLDIYRAVCGLLAQGKRGRGYPLAIGSFGDSCGAIAEFATTSLDGENDVYTHNRPHL